MGDFIEGEMDDFIDREIYDVVNNKDKFPEEFRKYVKDKNLICWEYRSSSKLFYNLYFFEKADGPDDDGVTSECGRLVDSLISFFNRDVFRNWSFLVQFWAAEQVVNSTVDDTINYRLTTRNLPFLLGDFWLWKTDREGLCRYRTKTCDVIVAGDRGGGAIGRVFRNKRIESTPHVDYYCSEDYHLRHVALSCEIEYSIVVPWFDSYGKVVGVIEFVSQWNRNSFTDVLKCFNGYLSSSLKETEMEIQSFVRIRPEMYDARNGVKHKFPEEFRKYVKRENLICWAYWKIGDNDLLSPEEKEFLTSFVRVVYDAGNIDFYVVRNTRPIAHTMGNLGFCVFQKAHAPTPECLHLAYSLISCFKRDGFHSWRFLVQFWAAEEVVNSVDDISETNYRLTTRNQPFLLGDFWSLNPVHQGLLHYRMKTSDVNVTGDGRSGAIGRVFRNKIKESIPDIGSYSFKEPLRDVALSCHIKHSLLVPWFDSYGKVVGVIEFVSPQNPDYFADVRKCFNEYLSPSLKEREMEIQSFVRVRPEMYDARNDLKHKFPKDFRTFVKRENLSCCEYRRIGREIYDDVGTDFYVFKKAHTMGSLLNTDHIRVHSECLSLVNRLIIFFKRDHFRMWNLLVQFWAAEQVVNSEIYRLTTRKQPFLLGNIRSWNPEHEGLCRYRMKKYHVIIAGDGDGGGGAIGHVFRNKIVKSTEDVGDYSSEEYPLRDVALSCHIKHSIVVPWFDSYRKVVGVIEFVSPQNPECFAEVLKYFNEYHVNFKVTIHANYGEDRFIRFQLSASSGIHELNRQLSERLGLAGGTYDLNYRDEANDPIELLCDDDLQLFISDSIENQIYTLMVFIVPK